MWKYIFSLLLLITAALPALSQSDTVRVRQEADWAPSALRVGTEVTGPLFGLFSEDLSLYEITADVDFHKYFLVA
ncbi:MAG: hypothetical protein WBH03_09160, partial [Cyclobacteriaceae bacterium]